MRARILLLVLALPSSVSAQYVIGGRDTLTMRVDSVFRSIDRNDSPGCAVGVYRDGRILYARGYGMANLEHGVPNSPRTVFDIGSVSKQFTATAILLLAQDGKLALDDEVRRYVPELPGYASGITLRHLLNHTGGIRDFLTLMRMAGRNFDGVADTVDFMRVITRSREPNFPIGTRYLYSNSGYALLGQIVYRVSGQPLAQFLRTRVLDPLGMRDSRSLDNHTTIIPNRAQGYAPRGTGFRIAASQFDGSGGAGAMHSTVEDFAAWDRNWSEPTVGGRALLDSLRVRGKLKNDSTISYALGIQVSQGSLLNSISHGGSWAGYRAFFLRFPEEHLSVATFCNLTTAGPDTLALNVARVYLGAKLGPDTTGAWERALLSAPAVQLTADELRPYAGAWRNLELGLIGRTRMVGDSLMGGVETPRRLVPLGPGRFREGRAEFTFSAESDGVPARLRVRTRGGTTRYERTPLEPFTPAQLAAYAGDYHSEEIETTNTLVADSGRLVVTKGGWRAARFEPVARDLFVGGEGVLEFTRDARGRITGMVVQAGRVRNLRFTPRDTKQ